MSLYRHECTEPCLVLLQVLKWKDKLTLRFTTIIFVGITTTAT